MRKLINCFKLVVLVAAMSASLPAWAQDDVGDLFKSGTADATKLVNAYLSPLFKGLGSGLNAGWTNTAKSKGTLRFELRVSVAGALISDKDRTYDINTLGLSNIRPVNPAVSTGPTAFGSDQQGAAVQLVSSSGTPTGQTFNLPEGLGFHIVPTPQLQLTVGLPKHIDVSLRLVPEIKISDDGGKVSMFGLGTKVELLPLFMGKATKVMPFDLAADLGFSQIKFTLPLNTNGGSSDQRIESKFNGFHFDAIISKKLLFFTPFASVGYQTSSTNLAALGTYSFDVPVTPSTPTGKQNFTDPVVIKRNDLGGIRASAGFQLKLAILKIYGSFTVAEVNTVHGGIAFGFGN